MNFNNLVLAIKLSLLVFSVIYFIILISNISKLIINNIDMKRYNLDMYLDITFSEVNDMIDDYISDIFDTYVILEGYAINTEIISQKEENEINVDIGKLVALRMSKNMYDKISLFFSHASIPDILSEKIGMLVMNYRINHNANVEELINLERENRKNKDLYKK